MTAAMRTRGTKTWPRFALALVALLTGACTDLLGTTDITPATEAGSDADGGRAPGSGSGSGARQNAAHGSGGDANSTSQAVSSSGSASSCGSSSSSGSGSGLVASTCGAVARCGADGGPGCCASPEVTGGTYDRLSSKVGWNNPATVSGFRLDEYLVTVGRFRLFTAAWNAGYRPAVGSGRHTHLNADAGLVAVGDAGTAHESGWIAAYAGQLSPTDEDLACDPAFATWTAQPGAHESLPINCVNWYEAYAFCIWDGGFLPSEAEWEYTAVGGSEQRTYPWGSTPPGTESQYAICGCYYGGSGSCSGVTSIAPVGTPDAGTGLWGQRDLAGELSEWNLDGYFASYVEPCDDCAYLGATTERVIRGGGFDSSGALLVSATRDASDPAARVKDVGVRCARVP